jgi:acetylornithine deacetylase/succinyl-diaminopimelate desuccinylase-like protein
MAADATERLPRLVAVESITGGDNRPLIAEIAGQLVDAGAAVTVLAAPPAGVLVGEPTELRVVGRHKGKAALRITVRGRAAPPRPGPGCRSSASPAIRPRAAAV